MAQNPDRDEIVSVIVGTECRKDGVAPLLELLGIERLSGRLVVLHQPIHYPLGVANYRASAGSSGTSYSDAGLPYLRSDSWGYLRGVDDGASQD